jgi:hypothetical protein
LANSPIFLDDASGRRLFVLSHLWLSGSPQTKIAKKDFSCDLLIDRRT